MLNCFCARDNETVSPQRIVSFNYSHLYVHRIASCDVTGLHRAMMSIHCSKLRRFCFISEGRSCRTRLRYRYICREILIRREETMARCLVRCKILRGIENENDGKFIKNDGMFIKVAYRLNSRKINPSDRFFGSATI